MVLGSTQPLAEISTRNLPEGNGQAARKADNLTAICEPIVKKNVWEPRRLTTLWVSTACYRDRFTIFPFHSTIYSLHNNVINQTACKKEETEERTTIVRTKTTRIREGG
jgi:hypothetical protein